MKTLCKDIKLKLLGLTIILAFLCLGVYLSREKTITLDVDGRACVYKTKAVTVGSFLEEQEIACGFKDYINPSLEHILTPGTTVVMKKNAVYEITVDGMVVRTEHYSTEIRDIMEKAGIGLGVLDKVIGLPDKTEQTTALEVIRVKESLEVAEEEVAFLEERVLDPELKRGVVQVSQKGEKGLVRNQYLLHWENGMLTERRLIASEVLKSPLAQVTVLGTKDNKNVVSRSLVNPQRILTVLATAYTHTGNRTYTGVYPRVGTIAVDPKVIPLGSRLWVEGYGYGIAQDTGGLIKGNKIDLFMDSKAECFRWGRKKVKVYVLEEEKSLPN